MALYIIKGETWSSMVVRHTQEFSVAQLNLLCLPQADQICYAVLCVFSYVAAGSEQKKMEVAQEHAKMAAAAAAAAAHRKQ